MDEKPAEPQVTIVDPIPVEMTPQAGDAGDGSAQRPASPQSSVAMQLSAAGVEFRLDTRIDHSHDLVALAAKIELLTSLYEVASNKLERALIRIGQLEAELEVRRQMQDQDRDKIGDNI